MAKNQQELFYRDDPSASVMGIGSMYLILVAQFGFLSTAPGAVALSLALSFLIGWYWLC